MTTPYDKHKRRWYSGNSDSKYYLNEAMNNFNELVDNKLSPSVHTVKCTLPLDYDIENRFEENILISDLNRMEQIKDQKLLHVKLNSEIDSGSIIYWNNEEWIVSNEEHNSVQSHKTFTIIKCNLPLNVQFNGSYYNFPIYISNLTIYSDGTSELVDMTLSSAKYSIQIVENEITNTIDVGTRFIVRGRAFEVTIVDDFTIKNVRTLTIVETVANSLDDLENDIAWNENLDIEDIEILNPNLKIIGDDFIYIGGISEYLYTDAIEWELERTEKAKIISSETGKCKIKCGTNSDYVGEKLILYATDEKGNMKEKKIYIRGMF